MSIFKKIFGGQDDNKTTESAPMTKNVIEEEKIKRTIFDFFQLDIKNIPDDSFIAGEVETNASGDPIQMFRKTLNYKECGIFDTVEIVVVNNSNDKNVNVFFKTFSPNSVNISKLSKLIDDLYLIHGSDSSNKGKFTKKDISDYNDPDSCMVFGRDWREFPNYNYPVAIDRDDDVLNFSIWGANN